MLNKKTKIKENSSEILTPSEVDKAFLKSIETIYGPINMEDDFFSSDLEKYYKTDSKDEETGGIEHRLIKLASFDDIITNLFKANSSAEILQKNKLYQSDTELQRIFSEINRAFNDFRTHLRKKYPEQYNKYKDTTLNEESSTGATGNGPLTPKAFKKPIKEAALNDFQNKRIKAFDDISNKMNNIYPMISNAKNKTSAFYSSNPESNKIIYPTELLDDYLEDMILILKQEN